MAAKSGKITEEIINAEYQAVYHYILSLCRDEIEAEDITQDTFVKAISTENFRGESSYGSINAGNQVNFGLKRCRKKHLLQQAGPLQLRKYWQMAKCSDRYTE